MKSMVDILNFVTPSFGARRTKPKTLIQRQWGCGEGEPIFHCIARLRAQPRAHNSVASGIGNISIRIPARTGGRDDC